MVFFLAERDRVATWSTEDQLNTQTNGEEIMVVDLMQGILLTYTADTSLIYTRQLYDHVTGTLHCTRAGVPVLSLQK